MGTGNESKVRPGEPLRIDAGTWNDMVDVVRWYKRTYGAGTSPGPWSFSTNPTLTVLVSNDTGTDFRDAYHVVRVEGMQLTPDARTKYMFGKRPVVEGFLPNAVDNMIAIVQQPLSGGMGTWGSTTTKIGLAVFRGITLARLRLTNVG